MTRRADRVRFSFCRSQVICAAAVAAAVLVTGCGGSGSDEPPPPPPSINVSTTGIDAEAAGETVSVNVSNGGSGTLNWTAAVAGSVAWARIASGASGANSGTITIEIDANSGAAREFEVTVMASGAQSRTITVQQAEAPSVIELTAADTELDGEGGSISLSVRNTGHATMQWSASLPEDTTWAYIESGEEGTDAGEIVVRYALNGGAERSLEVTVTASAATNSPQSLALSQDWFAASACTYPEALSEVLDLMEKFYYFNDEPEQQARYDGLDLEDYGSINALLDELRWKPETHDRNFSYWTTARQSDMVFAGQAFIFGFRMRAVIDINSDLLYFEVTDVYADATAGRAGLERGDKIVGLNGKSVDGLTPAQVNEELGPNEEGFEVSLEVENQSGERRTLSMAKGLVEVPTVPEEHVQVFDTDAGKVGYLHFRTFFGDANMRLLDEFAEFNAAGVRNLIVDLRYNGGGSVPIANGLATLIAGPELFENQTRTVLTRRVHNEVLSSEGFDVTTYFGCHAYPTAAMTARCESESAIRNVEKVVFITGRGSASASELVITGLQPYENVALVGDRTYGKPVGQYGLRFCLANFADFSSRQADLWAVAFAAVNAEGFEDYYEGIQVTEGCEAEDDVAHQLGDPEEALLAAALRYLETGSCAESASSSSRMATQRTLMPPASAQDPVTFFLGH